MNNNFINHTSKEMQDIAFPLQKYFDINFFGYIKSYKDTPNVVALTTSENWANWFVRNITKCHLGNINKQKIKISLWENMPDQTIYDLMHHDFNISHGIRFYYEHHDHAEIFSFAINQDNRSIIDWYLNNIDVLEKFILHFTNSSKQLIQLCDKNKLEYSNNFTSREIIYNEKNSATDNKQEFLNEIYNAKYDGNKISAIFRKDTQQMRCVKLLANGLMIKEIANQLGLSPKTVEHYLSNVRRLVGAKNSKDLVAIYYTQLMNFQATN